MSPAAAALGIFVLVVVIAIVALTVHYLKAAPSALPGEFTARRAALGERLDRILASVPDRPRLDSDEVPDHPAAARIEARLLGGDASGALDEAENLLAETPEDARVHILLARVLVHTDEIEPAWGVIERARALGGEGPMIDYLEGRAHHLRVLRRVNPDNLDVQGSPVPSLVTPFEMFILQLEQQRQRSQSAAALWLASASDSTRSLGHDEITALVVDHFTAYYDSLDRLSAAALAAPSFSDALYHTARLALKAGFIRQGMQLMDRIEPHMQNSPEKRFYDRDLGELHDRDMPAALVDLPPVPATARRSRSLKVLG